MSDILVRNTIYPLIIIGMHRSGTSLLARLLQEAGMYIGNDCSRSHAESKFFLARNKSIFQVAHAEWDNPEPLKYLLRDDQLCDALIEYLAKACSSRAMRAFQGWAGYLKNRSLSNLDKPWGWKDPRSTWTLPLWLRVFPNARVLNIYRNGVDVANSLWVREQKRRGQLNNPLLSCRCLIRDNAFALWAEYVEMSFEVTVDLPVHRVYHLCYETFLEHPLEQFSGVSRFAGLDLSEKRLRSIVQNVKNERACAFLSDPELVELYKCKANHPLLTRLGYGELLPGLQSQDTM